MEKNTGPPIVNVRRRVYCLGISSMLLALAQIVIYFFMLGITISVNYYDTEVALGSSAMIVLTGIYLAFTGRVLFLFYERRYEDAKGPEWLWWYATVVIIIFNMLLFVWFMFLQDFILIGSSAFAVILYSIFFKYAVQDIKNISERENIIAKEAKQNENVTDMKKMSSRVNGQLLPSSDQDVKLETPLD